MGVKAIDLYANGASSVYYDDVSLLAIPEPMTATMLGMMAVALILRRRRAGR